MSVRLEKEGGVGVIVLDRPPANSYDYAFLRELASAIDDARVDMSIKSAVVVASSLSPTTLSVTLPAVRAVTATVMVSPPAYSALSSAISRRSGVSADASE